MAAIPTHPEEFGTDWLAEKLGAPAGALKGFEAEAIGTGQMCDSFRLKLDWEGHDGPAAIVAKCPSRDPASRGIARTVGCYALEVGWYRNLAEEIPVNCPHCFHAEIADNETDFALLLADLAPARQGDQLRGAELAEIEAAIGEAAKLHAPYWGRAEIERHQWLRRAEPNQGLVRTLLPGLFEGFRERYRERLAPEILDMGAALVGRIEGYVDRVPAARTVVHADFRIDNLLFHPQTGEVAVVDWQTVAIGAGATDIAYLLGTSIADPGLRAAEERRLVDLYVARLAEAGAEADPGTVWEEYRRSAFAGFIMAVFASMNVVRTERGDEMFAVMAERPARQALDLDSLALI